MWAKISLMIIGSGFAILYSKAIFSTLPDF